MGLQRSVLPGQEVIGAVDLCDELAGRCRGRRRAFEPQAHLVVERPPPLVELGRQGGIPECFAAAGAAPRLGDPRRDHLVVGMAGHALGTERDDRVGAHGAEDPLELFDPRCVRDLRQLAVPVVEPQVLADVDDVEALLELPLAQSGELLWRTVAIRPADR